MSIVYSFNKLKYNDINLIAIKYFIIIKYLFCYCDNEFKNTSYYDYYQ